jgi:hypothetical protein
MGAPSFYCAATQMSNCVLFLSHVVGDSLQKVFWSLFLSPTKMFYTPISVVNLPRPAP